MIQLRKKTVEFPMVQDTDQIVCVAVANARQLPQAEQTERIIDLTVVLHVRSPGPGHRKTMKGLT